jgi:chromosome segregation ATPase
MKVELSEKEKEINNIRQKEQLTKEMTSMLDSAYSEFSVLQSKIQKLESQLTASRMLNLEYEDLKEAHIRLKRDLDEHKTKLNAVSNENQQLQSVLTDTEDKLREANFQRLQLQKRVTYLEELNNDFQVVSDANKKLEGQLRRIGELESLLNVTEEERDNLVRKHEDK